MVMPLYCIVLKQTPILEQLQLEEALLRTDTRNFCIINYGSPRSIVMGISGQADQMLDRELVQRDQIPVIQRFSGGGTVVVDESTLFVSFLFSKQTLPIASYPEPILRWSAALYAQAWQIPGFALRENDYAIAAHKCGGNAQYIQKDRWLHHTTFLWDYSEENMRYLKMPERQPHYRQKREHKDFLCRLKDHAPSQEWLVEKLWGALGNVKPFYIEPLDPKTLVFGPHRKATTLLNI
ncbi:MAG: lipoate--protein ligase family protein [Chlamydiia bacterium]|nr:lipoate--protein ligase family protein [Chlamydiia bacterium]